MCRTNPKCKLSTKFFFIINTKKSCEKNYFVSFLYLCSFFCRQQGHKGTVRLKFCQAQKLNDNLTRKKEERWLV